MSRVFNSSGNFLFCVRVIIKMSVILGTLSKTGVQWPVLSNVKCCQVTSLSVERTDHHVLLKAACVESVVLCVPINACRPSNEKFKFQNCF